MWTVIFCVGRDVLFVLLHVLWAVIYCVGGDMFVGDDVLCGQ